MLHWLQGSLGKAGKISSKVGELNKTNGETATESISLISMDLQSDLHSCQIRQRKPEKQWITNREEDIRG